MVETVRPSTESDVQAAIASLASRKMPVEVRGAGSKTAVGRSVHLPVILETRGLDGITLYEPSERVMSARSGTPLARIEAALAERGQMLAFEPIELGPLTGGPARVQTIGGMFATNISGPRRIVAGAARDHLIGVRAVNGRGELFKSGGRVLKNVTGYDVARSLSGSWGTLAVLSEVTFKVQPVPESSQTLIYVGLTDEIGIELLCAAMATPYEVSGTLHLSAGLTSRLEAHNIAREAATITAIRVENFAKSVNYRVGRLVEALKIYGDPIRLENAASVAFWSEIQRWSVLTPVRGEPDRQVWRISTAPLTASKITANLRRSMHIECAYDASGGVIWLEVAASADASAADIRRVLSSFGGHATLIRADADVRTSVDVFQPLPTGVERLTRGIKDSFDPQNIFNPGRMYANV